MSRFVIEHLPRLAAQYQAVPVDHNQARSWLRQPGLISLIRTTELISAIDAGLGVSLVQSDDSMTMQKGDEALLVGLSFGVLLAWAEGKIPPLAEDWRCISLMVEDTTDRAPAPVLKAVVAEPISADEGVTGTSC
jgi:hypothetical protein